MSYELGKSLIKKKKFKEAINLFKNILHKKPNDFRAYFQIGKIYYELNDIKKSIFFFEKSDQIYPQNSNILFNLALSLQSIGKIRQAKEKYLNIISINPKDVKSYYGLFFLDKKNITPKFLKNLKILVKDGSISQFERCLINFIFSKIEKNKGNIENEINLLNLSKKECLEANLIYNEQSNFYYKKIISNYYNKIKFVGNYKPLDNFNKQSHIFIIGLPRSGSTLVETIISHNSRDIYSFGEFHGINTSILDQVGSSIFSENFKSVNYDLILNKELFQNSLLDKYNIINNKIFLDKSLENFFNVEIILEFFPNAKFIHTHRNINDSIIGIYQTMLPELSWSHKIKDIIIYIDIYKEVINYFKKKYPDKILDIDLVKLSNQKEIESKKILNFCNIKFNDEFLNIDKNKKLFNKTNSFMQVKDKIHKYDDNKYQSYHYLITEINE